MVSKISPFLLNNRISLWASIAEGTLVRSRHLAPGGELHLLTVSSAPGHRRHRSFYLFITPREFYWYRFSGKADVCAQGWSIFRLRLHCEGIHADAIDRDVENPIHQNIMSALRRSDQIQLWNPPSLVRWRLWWTVISCINAKSTSFITPATEERLQAIIETKQSQLDSVDSYRFWNNIHFHIIVFRKLSCAADEWSWVAQNGCGLILGWCRIESLLICLVLGKSSE